MLWCLRCICLFVLEGRKEWYVLLIQLLTIKIAQRHQQVHLKCKWAFPAFSCSDSTGCYYVKLDGAFTWHSWTVRLACPLPPNYGQCEWPLLWAWELLSRLGELLYYRRQGQLTETLCCYWIVSLGNTTEHRKQQVDIYSCPSYTLLGRIILLN